LRAIMPQLLLIQYGFINLPRLWRLRHNTSLA
jgi:hypothetical protein